MTRLDVTPRSWMDGLEYDPNTHPDARVLVGFVKDIETSPGSTVLRLYINPDFRGDYVEISDGLIHRHSYGTKPRRTVLWLRKSASVKEVHVTPLDDQAWFLLGKITEAHLHQVATYPLLVIAGQTTVDPSVSCRSVCIKCLGE